MSKRSSLLDGSSGKRAKFADWNARNRSFIGIPRFEELLKSLLLLHELSIPIMLEGPMGSGKSALLDELYLRVHAASDPQNQSPVTLNLGEQSDAKTLFGAFIANPNRPGEFYWRAGVIVDAMQTGRWLIIEDIDLAGTDMLATLKGLLEARSTFYIPAMGQDIPVHPKFRIFATRRRSSSPETLAASGSMIDLLGKDLWQVVTVPDFSSDELGQLISGLFPALKPILSMILCIFGWVRSEESVSGMLKFCRRVEFFVQDMPMEDGQPIGEDIRRILLREAVDCFAAAWPDRASRQTLAADLAASVLALNDQEAEVLFEAKPLLALSADRRTLCVGRLSFVAEPDERPFLPLHTSASLAYTTLTSQVLERLALSIQQNEPVLLVGETGTGKTSAVQTLSKLLNRGGHSLRVVNMSQASEASDLLGGFKPFSAATLARPLLSEFSSVFARSLSQSRNAEFLTAVQEVYALQNWRRFTRLLRHAMAALKSKTIDEIPAITKLEQDIDRFEQQSQAASSGLLFSFVEGALVEAITNGHWLLLDELNLASPETLHILAGLLRDPSASLTLSERGDHEPLQRHPNFRLFACMNPATDVGKRDLPPGLRSCFTTIYVDETDARRADLLQVIDFLLGQGRDGTLKERLTSLYYDLKSLVGSCEIVDANGRRPLLNLRTLARPIRFARSCEQLYGIDRALFEGWCLSFGTVLDPPSYQKFLAVVVKQLATGTRDFSTPLRPASGAMPNGAESVIIDGYVLAAGPLHASGQQDPGTSFVLTPSVKRNLAQLARAVMAHSYPILLEGPTSAGKTSLVGYLAARAGHHCVRINNHEHTDLQEYLGSYIADPTSGQLVFQEGVLVKALRQGHWLILDELNLAPSDILEALNRLLDDNRELYLTETGEVVKPHPNFLLFATQNPAGSVYGGRKALSRAFRSRFIELQVSDLPIEEVEQILAAKSAIAPPFARRIAVVYRQLQEKRGASTGNIFAGRHSLITLRDCFRWADRQAGTIEELAEDGVFVLAERCRSAAERTAVQSVIETVCKLRLPAPAELYSLEALGRRRDWDAELVSKLAGLPEAASVALNLTWTKPIQRLATLLYLAMRHGQAALLVGETGCGKTTVVQLLASFLHKKLFSVSAHANSEASDFLGSFRPVRTADRQVDDMSSCKAKLFEWQDGPLVEAMCNGQWFLLDEISLAEDSVLERLNSVLESDRSLLLAECGDVATAGEARSIRASDGFTFVATMNPGGDFGKKELSPALRNRFIEIWVPTIGDADDLSNIIAGRLRTPHDAALVTVIRDFWYWWQDLMSSKAFAGASMLSSAKRFGASLRDLTSLLDFVIAPELASTIADPSARLLHGVAMLFTDRLGSENSELKVRALNHLIDQLGLAMDDPNVLLVLCEEMAKAVNGPEAFAIGPFSYPKKRLAVHSGGSEEPFAFEANTTRTSTMRVLRALQLNKAILLEGSPGVGKTTLIGALAGACNAQLTRINLSEQTDLVDLFGSDFPVEGERPGTFRWCDGPFLQALKRGDWILLDELNLASQSVLEGLNACLDHRGTVYIPELGREFSVAPGTRIFAAQNPAGQGGGRKGLPKSFLNRFTIVWCDALNSSDYHVILSQVLPENPELIAQMIQFNDLLSLHVVAEHRFGSSGRPWEFNLRDLLRWAKLIKWAPSSTHPAAMIRVLYGSRFRSASDKEALSALVASVFGPDVARELFERPPFCEFDPAAQSFQLGLFRFPISGASKFDGVLLSSQLESLEAAALAVEMGWLCILTGPAAAGKSSVIDILAGLHRRHCRRFYMSSDTDALELLGSFEQADHQRRWNFLLEDLAASNVPVADLYGVFDAALLAMLKERVPEHCSSLLSAFEETLQSDCEGRFEWVDGPLVRAMLLGQWLVLDGANLASSAVLDRLNSLFEPAGHLALSEQGTSSKRVGESIRIIRPAPGFRMFMTVDPRFGEISRAMRNRGLEIALLPQPGPLDDLRLAMDAHSQASSLPLSKEAVHYLLASKTSRRDLVRVAKRLGKDSSLLIATGSLHFDDSAAFWIESVRLPLVQFSKLDRFIGLTLQEALISPALLSADRADFIGLLVLLLGRWHRQCPASGTARLHALAAHLSPLLEVSCLGQEPLEILAWLLGAMTDLSIEVMGLIQRLVQKKSFKTLGYLASMLLDARSQTNSASPTAYKSALRSMLDSESSKTELAAWNELWMHFGFKREESVALYADLQKVLGESNLAWLGEASEAFDTLCTLVCNPSIPAAIHADLNTFSGLLKTKAGLLHVSSISRAFMHSLQTSRMLESFGSRSLRESPPMNRLNLAMEWMSCIWRHSENPVAFFEGSDALGSLLAGTLVAWNSRKIRNEPELMQATRELLRLLAGTGLVDKKHERLALVRGLLVGNDCMDCDELAKHLIQTGCSALASLDAGIDPVLDVYQAEHKALLSGEALCKAIQRQEQLFQVAYFGKYIPYPEDDIDPSSMDTLAGIESKCLARPGGYALFARFQQLFVPGGHVKSTLKQAEALIAEGFRVSAPLASSLRSSLLHLRMLLLGEFASLRDLIAPIILSIDRFLVGLCLLQAEQRALQARESPYSALLSLSWPLSGHLPRDLNQAAIVLRLGPRQTGLVVWSLLGQLCEAVHEKIRGNDSQSNVFHFEGSKNDDDAMDEKMASELFGKNTQYVDEKALKDGDMEVEVLAEPVRSSAQISDLANGLEIICEEMAKNEEPDGKAALQWSFDFISRTTPLHELTDRDVYRVLLWLLSDHLEKRQADVLSSALAKRVSGRRFDFYHDSCPEQELVKASSLLEALNNRVAELLAQWPEHDVLEAIQRHIGRFMDQNAASTTMFSLLQLFEQLYLRAMDWEKYAASSTAGTQLGDRLSAILSLVVDWRRRELGCWRGLLDAVLESLEQELIASGEWLVLVRLALSVSSDLGTVLELIDTFMLSAPIGQFNRRLQILRVCCKLAAKSNSPSASIFHTASVYYTVSLAARIKEYLRKCRGPVESDLSAFLMTINWKDASYWQVRQVAAKSHRHLAKMIRRWKEALQMPLSALLNQLHIRPQLDKIDKDQHELAAKTRPLTRPATATSLGRKAIERLDALNTAVFSALRHEVLQSFGDEIIETVRELRASTEKSIQAKQKAFVDLIRELKLLGVRINKPVPIDSSIKTALLQLASSSVPSLSDAKGEAYFVKALEKWSKLASSTPHDDVAFRQAEIVRNSINYLIMDVLVEGNVRKQRESVAQLKTRISSLTESLRRRNTASIFVEPHALQTFLSTLKRFKSLLSKSAALFGVQRRHAAANLSAVSEFFRIAESSTSEVSSLLEAAASDGVSVVPVAVDVFKRADALLSSLAVEEEHCASIASDLMAAVKPALLELKASWTGIAQIELEVVPEERESLVHPILRTIQFLEDSVPLPHVDSIDLHALYADYLRKHTDSVAVIAGSIQALVPVLQTAANSHLSPETLELLVVAGERFSRMLDDVSLKWFQALARLVLILANVFLHVYEEGFCRPPEAEEPQQQSEDAEDGKNQKPAEGTGMGEGSGEKNVSNEIEFEEQVTGTLNDEEEEKPERDENDKQNEQQDKEEDRIDMSQDFEGQLEDLMEDKEDSQQNEEPQDDHEQPDDRMMDEETSPGDDQNKEQDEDVQELDPSWWDDKEDEEEVEVDPNQDQTEKLPDNKAPKPPQSREKDSDAENNEMDESPLTALDEHQENAEENDAETASDVDMAKEEEEEEEEAEGDSGQQPEDAAEERFDDEHTDDLNMPSDAESAAVDEQDKEDDGQEGEEQEELADLASDMDLDAEQLEDSHDQIQDERPQDAEAEAEDREQKSESPETDEPDEMADSMVNEHAEADHGAGQDNSEISAAPDLTDSAGNRVRTLDTRSEVDPLQTPASQPSSPAPLDESEKWKRTIHRLREQTAQSLGSDERVDPNQLTREQQYEKANPDDQKAVTVRAEAEQAVHAKDAPADDDDQEKAVEASMNEAEPKSAPADQAEDAELDEEMKDLKLVPRLAPSVGSAPASEEAVPTSAMASLPSWAEFEARTSDLAFELCEQLRLVLAPTLSTKLRGDYRTGKRLNLRKILPYIASQYRRDKIWLRRTRPSQRNYRICLAIDNSHSMADTGCVPLAFEAVATISQALERLEVGELALIGFGDQARILQPFSPGIAKVIDGCRLREEQLAFDEASTDMEALLNCALEAFTGPASASSSAATPWQLNLILSDGVCHHHDRIKPLIAQCTSARLLNVFIILDARPEGSSIFDLSHVEYTEAGLDPVTGVMRTGIKMTKYLDTFPFELYVVLRDVKMLPFVLADALKQWFEFVAMQEGQH